LYLSHRYYYLPISRKSWNRFECAVGGVRQPQHTHISSNSSTIAADSSNGVTNTRCCRYSCMRSWWCVEVPPETCRAVSRFNKLCNVASCWIYIGILLGAHYILYISRIRVNAFERICVKNCVGMCGAPTTVSPRNFFKWSEKSFEEISWFL
jgi:hypothetical protein